MGRVEHLAPRDGAGSEIVPGVAIQVFASAATCGSPGFTTGRVTIAPGASLPYHVHPCSEAITLLRGELLFSVEGRRYRLTNPYDCVHVPAGVAHMAANGSNGAEPCVTHVAFGSAQVTREFVTGRSFEAVELDAAPAGAPEHVARLPKMPAYSLVEGMRVTDLFAGRYGAAGICGGHAVFEPEVGMPCHVHPCDESITIVGGRATCQVAGRRYELSGGDTIVVPEARPHRFVNASAGESMAMVWVYARPEPERVPVDLRLCTG